MKDDNYGEPKYKFGEDISLFQLKDYIDSTYGQHYSQTKIQSAEVIIDNGHGEGFCIGNIIKYAQRYGKKDGKNLKDLMKILHYAIIMLYIHRLNEEAEKQKLNISTMTVNSPPSTVSIDEPSI